MKKNDDYFANHYRAVKFPFSIYHNPLVGKLKQFFKVVELEKKDAEVLVIGCGLMHELEYLPRSFRLTVIDIDPRVIDAVKKMQHPCVREARLIYPNETPAIFNQKFDAVYAKEVIEHIVTWQKYLLGIYAALRPGGRVWLSTPNYGEPWLPLLESSILEIIARCSGYSRKHIHPSRFSRRAFDNALVNTGFLDVMVQVVSYRLAIVGTAQKPKLDTV